MRKLEVFSPDTEVLGESAIPIINCLNAEHFRPYLEKHHLTHIEQGKWYPFQPFLDVLNELSAESEAGNAMFDFVSIGLRIVEDSAFPPDLKSIPLKDLLSGWNTFYRLNFRGTDPGEIQGEVVDDKHVKMIARVPFADDVVYGIFYGVLRHFLPPRTPFEIFYDPQTPRRDEGGSVTVIHLQWS